MYVGKLGTKVHNKPSAQGKIGDVTTIVGYLIAHTLHIGIEGVYCFIWLACLVHELFFKKFYGRRSEFLEVGRMKGPEDLYSIPNKVLAGVN